MDSLSPAGSPSALRDHPLIEIWPAENPALLAALPALTAAAAALAGQTPPPAYGERSHVNMLAVAGLDTVFCIEAPAHVDDAHDQWFILFTMLAAGQILHAKDTWPPNFRDWKREGHDPDMSAPLIVGDMVIIDGHRLHWMAAKADLPSEAEWVSETDPGGLSTMLASHWFAAACYDMATRPSRAAAEALILANIKTAAVGTA